MAGAAAAAEIAAQVPGFLYNTISNIQAIKDERKQVAAANVAMRAQNNEQLLANIDSLQNMLAYSPTLPSSPSYGQYSGYHAPQPSYYPPQVSYGVPQSYYPQNYYPQQYYGG